MLFYEYAPTNGQTVWDLAVMHYGTVEAVWHLLDDNADRGLTIDVSLNNLGSLKIRRNLIDAPLSDRKTANYFRENKILVNNGDSECNGIEPNWWE